MILKYNNQKNQSEFYWHDSVLQVLKISHDKYSIKDIEDNFRKLYLKRGYIELDNNSWKLLKLPGWRKKIRISILMNHLHSKFILTNERPKTEFYSHDYDFCFLQENELSKIINNL